MTVVGNAEITVLAITNQVKDAIRKAFRDAQPMVRAEGVKAGREFSKGFSEGLNLSDRVARELGKAKVVSRKAGKDAGKEFGESFNSGARQGIDLRGVGSAAGTTFGDGLDESVDQYMSRLETSVADHSRRAGDNGGNAFRRAFTGKFGDSVMQASGALTQLIGVGNLVGPAIGALVSSISAVISGLFAMGAAASQAAGALAVLPGVMSIAAQGMVAVKLAFSGVGAAVGAGFKAAIPQAKAAGKAGVDNAKAIRDAEIALARARQAAADAARDANKKVQDALREYKRSVIDVKQAELDLNAARRQGAEDLQQLAFSAEEAALSEERAGLALEDAYNKMVAAQQLPADSRARQEAELGFKEAELNYRQAKDRNSDIQKQEKQAAKRGVEGTEAVTNAKEALIRAQEAQYKAAEGYEEAQLQRQRTLRDNAQRIADAQRRLADAHAQGAKALDSGAKAADAYQQALSQLPKPAREFVKYLVSIQGEIKKLKASAGEKLFPQLQSGLESFVKNVFPILNVQLKETGNQLGGMAESFLKTISTGRGLENLTQILKGNNDILAVFNEETRTGNTTMGNLATILTSVGVAIQPITQRFAEWIKKLIATRAAVLGTRDGVADLQGFLGRAGDRAAQLGRIFGNLWKAIRLVGDAALPAGDSLLTSFEDATAELVKFLNTPEQNKKMKKYFEDVAYNMRSIGDLINTISVEFIKLGDNRAVGDFAKSLEPAVKIFGEIGDNLTTASPQLGEIATEMARIIRAFADSEGIKKFLNVLKIGLGIFADLVDNPVAKWFLGIVATVAAVTRGISFLLKPLKFFGKALLGGPVSLGRAFLKLKDATTKTQREFRRFRSDGINRYFRDIVRRSTETRNEFERQMGVDNKKRETLRRLEIQADRTAQALNRMQRAGAPQGVTPAQVGTTGAGVDADGRNGPVRQNADPSVSNAGRAAGEAYVSGFEAAVRAGAPGIQAAISSVLDIVKGPALVEWDRAGNTIARAFITSIGDAFKIEGGLIKPQLKVMLDQVREYGRITAVGGGERIGKGIGSGMRVGIRGEIPLVTREANNMADAVVDAVKLRLGIRSPSVVMASQGEDTGQGFIVGLRTRITGAFKAGEDLGSAASRGAAVGSAGVAAAGAGAAAAGAGRGAAGAAGAAAAVKNSGKLAGAASKALTPVKALGRGLNTLTTGLLGISLPVAAVIAALVGLFFFFKRLYKVSPEFKKFIDGIVDKLKALGDKIGEVFNKYVFPAFDRFFGFVNDNMPVVKKWIDENVVPPLEKVGDFFASTWKNVVLPAFDGLKKAVEVSLPIVSAVLKGLFEGIKFYITKIFIPVWETIFVAAFFVFKNIVLPIIKVIIGVIKVLFNTIKFLITKVFIPIWNNVLFPAFRIFFKIAAAVFKGVFTQARISFNIIRAVVRTVLAPAINLGKRIFQALWDKVKDVVKGIKDRWNNMKDAIVSVVDALRKKVNSLKERFGEIAGFVANAFSNLGAKAKDPINKFIEFLNDKMIAKINSVTKKFGLTISPIPKIAGKARGGRVQGVGTAMQDNQPHMLSVGEHVIRTRAAQRIGYGNLDYMNRTGRLPGVGGFGSSFVNSVGDVIGGAKDGIAGLVKAGVGNTLSAIVKTVGAGMGAAGIKRGKFMNDFFYGVLDKLAGAVKSWGDKKGKAYEKKYSIADALIASGKFGYPLAKRVPITQYPNRGHSPPWSVDLGAPSGTGVRAASSGIVKSAIDLGNRSYGRYIVIAHAKGVETLYAHLSKMLVKRGTKVLGGQTIGLSGTTGRSTGPHLHFELKPSNDTVGAMAARGVKLAKGGIAPATQGGIHAIIAEAGKNERVEPLDRDGMSKRDRVIIEAIRQAAGSGGGDTYKIYPSARMDEAELAEIVSRKVAWKRGTGT